MVSGPVSSGKFKAKHLIVMMDLVDALPAVMTEIQNSHTQEIIMIWGSKSYG